MPKVSFVMGATASGKTYFINHYFGGKDVDVLNIFDYQQEASIWKGDSEYGKQDERLSWK